MATQNEYSINLDTRFQPLELIDVQQLVDACDDPWYNQTLTKVNDSVVRLGVVQATPGGTLMPADSADRSTAKPGILHTGDVSLFASLSANQPLPAPAKFAPAMATLEPFAASTAVEIARIRYAAGSTDFTTVTQVQLALVQQEDTLAQVEGQIATGLIQTYRALGGGWQIRLAGCTEMPGGAVVFRRPISAFSDVSKPES